MEHKYIFNGSPKAFANLVFDNIETIANACGWSEVSNAEKPYTHICGKSNVEEIRIKHNDGSWTFLFCQVSNEGLPFNALITSKNVMECAELGLLQPDCICRNVIVSPNIDSRLIEQIEKLNYPANMMMVTPDKCKYWESPFYLNIKKPISCRGHKLTKFTKII